MSWMSRVVGAVSFLSFSLLALRRRFATTHQTMAPPRLHNRPLFGRAEPLSFTHKPGTASMTTFDDRESAFENKFAHDEEMQFKITARRNKLVGLWAAEKMGLTPEEADAYGKSVVQADFEEAGDEDVIRKLLGDLTSAGVDSDEAAIRAALEAKMVEARRQFIEEA
jgi:hypothetical protein